MINKRLLRQIKQEGYQLDTFKEGSIHSDIICNYIENKSCPDVRNMSNEQLETYLDELYDWGWRILPSISPQFSQEYYWKYNGEIYDVVDEIEYRIYLREMKDKYPNNYSTV